MRLPRGGRRPGGPAFGPGGRGSRFGPAAHSGDDDRALAVAAVLAAAAAGLSLIRRRVR